MKTILLIMVLSITTIPLQAARYYIRSNSFAWATEMQAIDGSTTNNLKEFVENNVTGSVASAKFLDRTGDTAGTLTISNLTFLSDNWVHGQTPLGDYSFSAGYGLASANNSIAIGNVNGIGDNGGTSRFIKATATNINSVAIGAGAKSYFNVIGYVDSNSKANGAFSLAMMGGFANGQNSIAIGTVHRTNSSPYSSTASAPFATALMGGQATASNAVAIGTYLETRSQASGIGSVAFGGGNASGAGSFSVNSQGGNYASGDRSVSFGGQAIGFGSFAGGDSKAYGTYSVAQADARTFTTYFGNVSAGGDRLDDGGNSVAFGGGKTFGRKCFSFGGLTSIGQTNYEMTGYAKFTMASNDYTVAIGMGSVATGIHSMAVMGAFAGRDDMVAMPDTDIQGVLNMTGNEITNAIYRGETNKFPDIAWGDLGGGTDLTTVSNQFLLKNGDTMTGDLIMDQASVSIIMDDDTDCIKVIGDGSDTFPPAIKFIDIQGPGADYTNSIICDDDVWKFGNKKITQVSNPAISNDVANKLYVDNATNACLQTEGAIATAGATGYLKSLDATGSNLVFTTNLWAVGSDEMIAITNALKVLGVF